VNPLAGNNNKTNANLETALQIDAFYSYLTPETSTGSNFCSLRVNIASQSHMHDDTFLTFGKNNNKTAYDLLHMKDANASAESLTFSQRQNIAFYIG
jgi:hypothetical protein